MQNEVRVVLPNRRWKLAAVVAWDLRSIKIRRVRRRNSYIREGWKMRRHPMQGAGGGLKKEKDLEMEMEWVAGRNSSFVNPVHWAGAESTYVQGCGWEGRVGRWYGLYEGKVPVYSVWSANVRTCLRLHLGTAGHSVGFSPDSWYPVGFSWPVRTSVASSSRPPTVP